MNPSWLPQPVRAVALFGALSSSLLLWSCRAPTPEGRATAGDPGRTIVLITVDALRCDILDDGDWQRRAMPELRRLGSEGESWSDCLVSASSDPETALRALLTGMPVLAASPTGPTRELARSLGEAGYRTLAWRAGARPRVPRRLEAFDEVLTSARLGEVLERLETLEQGPVFLWLHLSRAHPPWARIDRWLPRLGLDSRALPGEIGAGELRDLGQVGEAERRHAEGVHRSNLAAIDHQLSLVVAALDERLQAADSLLVVVGAEGVDLGESAEAGFATGLGRNQLQVPVVMRGRGAERLRPSGSGSPPGSARLAASLLDWAGVPAPPGLEAPLAATGSRGTASALWQGDDRVIVSWLEDGSQWLASWDGDRWSRPQVRPWGSTAIVPPSAVGEVPDGLRRLISGPPGSAAVRLLAVPSGPSS